MSKNNSSTRKSLLDMDGKEAKKFFLKTSSYIPIQLPSYFNFEKVLNVAIKKLNHSKLTDLMKNKRALSDTERVNYVLLINKDGQYDWRPVQIIHPLLYVNLVNKIVNNWDLILQRFSEFQSNKKIKCISIPVESTGKKSDKAETVLNWWENLEQASIKYSLQYDYCIKTDVTNCYGSIYTHSIAWAIMGKKNAKGNRSKNNFGNQLDSLIQGLQNGQTNGILQGGSLFDFIAEMVLGYSDECLTEELKKCKIENDYMIIRYRDDYRIFSNSKEVSEKIVRKLSEILSGLNMHFNSKKTDITTDIIGMAVKSDKLFWTTRRPSIFVERNKKIEYYLGLQKHLWQIYELSVKFPNSGSVTIALKEFLSRLLTINKNKEIKDLDRLISILVNIIIKSPKSIAMGTAVLGNLFKRIDNEVVSSYIEYIIQKMKNIPNVGYIEIWLQRLSVVINSDKEYEDPLSRKINSDENRIWDSSWLKKEFDESSIVDRKVIKSLKIQIPLDEVDLFSEYGK